MIAKVKFDQAARQLLTEAGIVTVLNTTGMVPGGDWLAARDTHGDRLVVAHALDGQWRHGGLEEWRDGRPQLATRLILTFPTADLSVGQSAYGAFVAAGFDVTWSGLSFEAIVLS